MTEEKRPSAREVVNRALRERKKKMAKRQRGADLLLSELSRDLERKRAGVSDTEKPHNS